MITIREMTVRDTKILHGNTFQAAVVTEEPKWLMFDNDVQVAEVTDIESMFWALVGQRIDFAVEPL